MTDNRYFFAMPVPFADTLGRTVLVMSVHGMRKLADALEASEPDLATRLREEADIRQRAAAERIAKRKEQTR